LSTPQSRKGKGERWSKDDRILVLALFRVLQPPYRKENSKVLEAARQTGKSPSSIVLKLQNFRWLQTGGNSGLSNSARGDRQVWREFDGREEALHTEAEQIRSRAV